MKTVVALALLVCVAQAVDWTNVQPRYAYKHTIRKESNASRIIGGNIASPGQFPFQAGIFLDGSGFCGGSLIKEDVVLTAAHCCEFVKTYEIHLGAQNIYDNTEATLKVISSTDGQMHEDYDYFNLDNDICIVRLGAAVSGSNIGTIRLPSRSQAGDSFEGSPATSSGWGRSSIISEPFISEQLMFVDVSIISNAECELSFGGMITPNHICIGTAGGSIGVCYGDSGGPLYITEGDGAKTLVGVTSFVSPDGCEDGSPHGFCRVTPYLDWLEQNAGVTVRP